MQPLDPGDPRLIGPYRLLGRLGAGGMGRVYLGRSAGGRTVAVKVVHPHFALDDEFRTRFRREVESARRVGGQWTAPVLDADPGAAQPWLATGYVAGPALSAAVTGHGPLPMPAVRALGAGLAEALTAVHALELVHRDVKPSNVLLTLDGPRLIDFGIARVTDGTASLTSTGVSVGSPGYMSPEQILGKGISGAADVFSLGAVLAYAATGSAPFSGDSSATLLYKVVHEEPELDGLEGELRQLVAGALAKNPGARPTPREIAGALAPGGAAALVAAGWLPGALVEQVSRAAVELLSLEPADPARGPEGPLSGPVAFSSPSVGGVEAARAGQPGQPGQPTGTTPGTFGPPIEPMHPLPSGHPLASVPQLPVFPAAGEGHAPWAPASQGDPSADPDPPPPTRNRRKVSCTLTLTLAAVLAGVTIGVGVLYDLLPGSGAFKDSDDTANAGPQDPAEGSTAPSAPGNPDSEQASEVPKAFIGTWEGPFTISFADTDLKAGTFTIVLKSGRTGGRIGTAAQYDALGNLACTDNLVLRKATATQLVTDGASNGRAGSKCTEGTHTVTLKLAGGNLRYSSDEPRAGNPRATLKRATN
ncbi:serine/threonine-protein kinase [Streptomyces albipurpureus]|uniref:Serine/threonine protein kinase n=1 Tax=Streptomyces albipurpureus TaxID=2897419 RepID=A0ABT0V0W9_9ACTN|nr:serine/threonine-protein kinase [Streptomyces sp. CWNU-1]MCM2393980.1 serine/threonine protein kinase [Streptomyces sp. CWNU-1]